jgi:hypothetical protein
MTLATDAAISPEVRLPVVSREMNLKGILCVPLGHKWGEAPDAVETYPVLRCKRCGRLRNMGDETRGFTPWTARGSSETGHMSGRVGDAGRPY